MYRLTLILALLILLSCSLPGGERDSNLVIITLDTTRRDAVGCYGIESAHTPYLDRLARNGALVADAQVPVPITLPSHATLFTGLYPANHGARHNGVLLPENARTLAEMLGDQGYSTAAFLAADVLNKTFGMNQGFDLYNDRWKRDEMEMGLYGLWERRGDVVVSAFLRWLPNALEEDRPFFAWIHLYDPHTPYTPPEPFTAALGGDGYAGEVAFIDRQVGRVIEALEANGLLDRTVVVAISDHGGGLGERGEIEHGLLLYENTLAIPWIMRAPGITGGQIIDDPAESTDLLPTLASLLPIDPDPEWPGRNILDLPESDEREERRTRYCETYYGSIGYHWSPLHGLRTGDWKLVRGTRDELFNLLEDPREETDLSGNELGVCRRMGRELDRIVEAQPKDEPWREAELTADQKAMLTGLGYVTPSRAPKRTDSDLLDPRDCFLAHELAMQGRSLSFENRDIEALPLFLKALRIDPDNVFAMNMLDNSYSKLGMTEKREPLLLAILAVRPGHASSWNRLADLAEKAGAPERALELYNKAVESESTYAEALVNRGNLHYSMNRLGPALDDYKQAVRVNRSFAWGHYGLALVHYKKGNIEKVVEELQLTLRYNPGIGEAREWLNRLEKQYGTTAR